MTLPFRLLAIDIDGTLLNSEFKLPAENLAALRRAHELGIEVILCTGRRHSFALPIAQQLGFALWLCSSNGAVTRSTGGESFHSDFLPAEVARQLCRHMIDFRGGTVLTFDKETRGALVVERMDELEVNISRWVEKNSAFIERVSPIEAALTCDPIQAMFCGTLERMRRAEARLAESPMAAHTTILKTEYPLRDLCLWDVLTRDCSKGHAVERWARHRGISSREVMAIGDNYNDLEMLQFAGLPVVMSNAPAELKRFGWLETCSNDEAGVAMALAQALGSARMKIETARAD